MLWQTTCQLTRQAMAWQIEHGDKLCSLWQNAGLESRIKLKTWTRQPVEPGSHSKNQMRSPRIERRQVVFTLQNAAHLNPGSQICWPNRTSRLNARWQTDIHIERRQVVVPLNARIGTPRHQIASRLNARWQTDSAIEDQAKNLNSTARPYDQRAFSPLDHTICWLSHLGLAIYIFVVVNFDALAQASDIQIERRQVVFLCRMQDLNPGSQTPNRQQTECSLTNRLSYRGSS